MRCPGDLKIWRTPRRGKTLARVNRRVYGSPGRVTPADRAAVSCRVKTSDFPAVRIRTYNHLRRLNERFAASRRPNPRLRSPPHFSHPPTNAAPNQATPYTQILSLRVLNPDRTINISLNLLKFG